MTEHGGNIFRAAGETGIPVRKIIDFSASINPLGVPDSVAAVIRESIPVLVHYPDPSAEDFSVHLGKHLDIDPRTILCGNGSTELIYLVVRALRPRRALIPAPTFSEYERACRMHGGTLCLPYPLSPENDFDIDPDRFISSMAGCDMAFLCNPNNPTGRLIDRDAVIAVARAAESLSCCLVVDEAFIDFVPKHSVVREVAGFSHLVVLRSLTKYYALPGLRVGYGVFPLSLMPRMNDHKEPWTINSLAQKAGIAALADHAYRERTGSLMEQEKRNFESGLRSLNIDYVPSSANFYLTRMDGAQGVIASLREAGILVRDCSNFTGLDRSYIRVAVRSREENAALLRSLQSRTRKTEPVSPERPGNEPGCEEPLNAPSSYDRV